MTGIVLDPTGERHGLPTFPWKSAPAGLATRRQLAALGLRPGGRAPVAQIMRPRRRRPAAPLVGYLYEIDGSPRKRPCTPAMWRAVAAAVRARQTCGQCSRWVGYVPPLYTGRTCWDCMGLTV